MICTPYSLCYKN